MSGDAEISLFRRALGALVGQTHGGQRDLYDTCGWTRNPAFDDFYDVYDRNPVGFRAIAAYPAATWKNHPIIVDDDDPKNETPFEQDIKTLQREFALYANLATVDTISGIHQFAVLVLGLDDVTTREGYAKEIKPNSKLVYLRPFLENSVKITKWELSPISPRYGLPVEYEVTLGGAADTRTKDRASTVGTPPQAHIRVHWSRVIHVAEGALEVPYLGTPRTRKVLNNLHNLEKILGAGAEAFWQTAVPGLAFNADPDVDVDLDDKAWQKEIDGYVHRMKRYMRLQGVDVKALNATPQDPTGTVNVELKMISAGTNIPVRILTGSERGELASSTDEDNWRDRVHERRESHAKPNILRPTLDRLIKYNAIRAPKENTYDIEWTARGDLSPKEQVDIDRVRATILQLYAQTPGMSAMMPLSRYAEMFLGMNAAEAKALEKSVDLTQGEEDLEIDSEDDED